jgi:hypothetical protein
MRLSAKHANQQIVSRADFSGGLNTSMAIEMIADNELADCMNMDVDQNTKLLKTASGTTTLYKPDYTIAYAVYDKINRCFLLIDTDRNVYRSDLSNSTKVGQLNGTLAPKYTDWENGVLITSGSLLQYYDGTSFKEIDPDIQHDIANWQLFTVAAWAASTAYALGEVVTYSSNSYRCITAHTAAVAFDSGKWAALTDKGTWQQNTSYAQNDYVSYAAKNYYCTTAHKSATKLSVCDGVYIRSGRVLINYDDMIRYSGIGDEENWTEDNNDASTSKFLEAGYKDGGNIIGMSSLSDSIIVIKSNHRIYKVNGEFPNWTVAEISRNVDCKSRLSYCSVMNNTIILGSDRLQIISTTDEYGDMKVANAGQKISTDISGLSDNTRVVFVSPLNQVWLIGDDGLVIIYDLTFSSFYKRQFNSPVLDVISVNEAVYVIKADRVSKLSPYHFADDDKELSWGFRARRIMGENDILVKRIQLSITPRFEQFCDGRFWVGSYIVDLPMPFYLMKVWHNKATVYHNRIKLKGLSLLGGISSAGDYVYQNPELLYHNRTKLWSVRDLMTDNRCVVRGKRIELRGHGSNGAFLLNSINMDVVEV